MDMLPRIQQGCRIRNVFQAIDEARWLPFVGDGYPLLSVHLLPGVPRALQAAKSVLGTAPLGVSDTQIWGPGHARAQQAKQKRERVVAIVFGLVYGRGVCNNERRRDRMKYSRPLFTPPHIFISGFSHL